ncbi:hypothetical protein K239x_21520 [Planctomycetes bacterium K23_9]|uniref:Prophage CP4-57 regulatory protein (AlpA) n=1 Tax=Stieleria marina TaxID=1930275 RepID=A0A517NST6_9BACT|nr:hypothetical protein K239x_21520 [Planctomycetes bacterium K23_9]
MSTKTSTANAITDGNGRAMLDVPLLAKRWGVSEKSVRRMADAGRIPRPVKLLSMLRWPISQIEAWENSGCPNVRNAAKRGRS